ncbi:MULTISPECIES: hypothetical protein [Acidiphilium]|jgi:hypothetical protein|nr:MULTISPECIES: hypothetical protein [Acidiphilium]HQT84734.1 hypothetical protein [Acidiphilium rubrum]
MIRIARRRFDWIVARTLTAQRFITAFLLALRSDRADSPMV